MKEHILTWVWNRFIDSNDTEHIISRWFFSISKAWCVQQTGFCVPLWSFFGLRYPFSSPPERATVAATCMPAVPLRCGLTIIPALWSSLFRLQSGLTSVRVHKIFFLKACLSRFEDNIISPSHHNWECRWSHRSYIWLRRIRQHTQLWFCKMCVNRVGKKIGHFPKACVGNVLGSLKIFPRNSHSRTITVNRLCSMVIFLFYTC